jgi:hypothetical protein
MLQLEQEVLGAEGQKLQLEAPGLSQEGLWLCKQTRDVMQSQQAPHRICDQRF